jgi:hypothetical protein
MEMNLIQLQEQGKLQWKTGADLKSFINLSTPGSTDGDIIKPDSVYVFDFSTPEMESNLKFNVKMLLGQGAGKDISIPFNKRMLHLVEIPGNPQELPVAGLGFDKNAITNVREIGFYIVLRPENRPRFNAEEVERYLNCLENIRGVTTIIFGGTNEVIGFPDNLDTTIAAFKKSPITFGDIEAPNIQARQKGAQYLTLKIPDKTVRVMSLPPMYLAKLNPYSAIDKFRLAVRERNIRLIYLRPFWSGFNGKDIIETNLDYISTLRAELKKFNFNVNNPASKFPLTNPSPIFVILIALAAASVFLLLLESFYEYKGITAIIIISSALIFSASFIFLGKMHIVQKIIGLLIAFVFPVYAFTSRLDNLKIAENANFLKAFGYGVKNFTIITLITLTGAIMIAGLFASTVYMIAADQFRGIKLIMIVPPLLTIFAYYFKGKDLKNSLREFLNQPLLLWQVALLGILGVIGIILVMRSGNAGEAISTEQEQSLRVALEEFLWIRPRFKDFAIGHPAMILTWAFSHLQYLQGLGILVLFGAIGQGDIMDTFAHIHTPVYISLVRVILGAGIGIIFGGIFLAVYQTLKKYFVKNSPQIEQSKQTA